MCGQRGPGILEGIELRGPMSCAERALQRDSGFGA